MTFLYRIIFQNPLHGTHRHIPVSVIGNGQKAVIIVYPPGRKILRIPAFFRVSSFFRIHAFFSVIRLRAPSLHVTACFLLFSLSNFFLPIQSVGIPTAFRFICSLHAAVAGTRSLNVCLVFIRLIDPQISLRIRIGENIIPHPAKRFHEFCLWQSQIDANMTVTAECMTRLPPDAYIPARSENLIDRSSGFSAEAGAVQKQHIGALRH